MGLIIKNIYGFTFKRINSLPISATLSMAAKARELKNNGVDIIGLVR